jgi:hypothetical protein
MKRKTFLPLGDTNNIIYLDSLSKGFIIYLTTAVGPEQ